MDLKTAHALASASHAVYDSEEYCEQWAMASGYDEFHWIESFDTQAMVVANDHACVLAFRGTEPTDIGDWMTDMDIRMVKDPFGMVHQGFQEAYEIVEDEVREVINDMPGENLYITGHSLGGALATVAAAHLPPRWSVYNFGSPRVGDEDYAGNVSKREFYRFTNNNDVVPRVPLSIRFAHAGDNYHFTTFGGMLKNPKNWRLTYDRFVGRLRWGVVDGIRDHNMGTYAQLVYKHMLG
jgi:pimeloyl-ACP methyl ester carboxylesterase